VTLAYRPGDSFAHRLDPRTKLGFQAAFALAAFAHTTPRGLFALTVVAALALRASGASARRAVWGYRFALPLLLAGPLFAAATLGPPWVRPAEGVETALASYRVLLVLLVSAAYVRSTPVRASRAAIQRLVPGRAGQFLGAGVGFVFRFFPVLRGDLRRIRDASTARLGDEQSVVARIRRIGIAGLARALSRADRFAVALRARCFAWNPTLPRLSLSRIDAPVIAASGALAAWAVV